MRQRHHRIAIISAFILCCILVTTNGLSTSTASIQMTTQSSTVASSAENISTTAAEPVITTAEPVISTAEPVVTTAEPAISTAEPVITTAEPVIYTAEPVINSFSKNVTTDTPRIREHKDSISSSEGNSNTFLSSAYGKMALGSMLGILVVTFVAGGFLYMGHRHEKKQKEDAVLIMGDVENPDDGPTKDETDDYEEEMERKTFANKASYTRIADDDH